MLPRTLTLHDRDDLIVALQDHQAGEVVEHAGRSITLLNTVAAKHKFTCRDIAKGESVKLYGVTAGRATVAIQAGSLVTTSNLVHDAETFGFRDRASTWTAPDTQRFSSRTFDGYVRDDGAVGTANMWVVVPMVFCQERNLRHLQKAMLEELGYTSQDGYRSMTRELMKLYGDGATSGQIIETDFTTTAVSGHAMRSEHKRLFPHVDGIKFLSHSIGCGGTPADATDLCRLLAGYINHPNVAGATVLSLGCQNAQVSMLQEQLHKLNPVFSKPMYIFEQQKLGSEANLMNAALRHTFAGLMQADLCRREPAPLNRLTLGVECGGSDGFSGISANPAIGHAADLLVALGGKVILAEFPELVGAEQEVLDRCVDRATADRFLKIMSDYSQLAAHVGAALHLNPSPGNIADGLITDAIKSLGAIRKGGTSSIVDVLDYPEPVKHDGLSLLCTPGGDVESTTALVGSGANVLAFSTGMGTPTGNPITPVLKISSNTAVSEKMPDIIDLDAGPIITGEKTIEQVGEELLDKIIRTASGRYTPMAVRLEQDDFIPWKRTVSL